MNNLRALQIAAIIAAGGLNVELISTEEARKRWPDPTRTIDPPPRYRDIKILGSYDDNVQPRTPRAPDPERMSAAEAKRARKAAKLAKGLSK